MMRHVLMSMALVMGMASTALAQEETKPDAGETPAARGSKQETGELWSVKSKKLGDTFMIDIGKERIQVGQLPKSEFVVFQLRDDSMRRELSGLLRKAVSEGKRRTIRVDYTVDDTTGKKRATSIAEVEPSGSEPPEEAEKTPNRTGSGVE
jgi:hypothetical protein